LSKIVPLKLSLELVLVKIKSSIEGPQEPKTIHVKLVLVGTTTTPKEVTSGGESFHTILVTHGILRGEPPNGDPPNDDDGELSCGGHCNDGLLKSFQHASYPNWYVGLVVPTPHMILKSLPYFIYKEGTNPDVHVWIFRKAICINKEKDDVGIINLFCFTLCDTISKWGKNFLQFNPICTFVGLENVFCKQ